MLFTESHFAFSPCFSFTFCIEEKELIPAVQTVLFTVWSKWIRASRLAGGVCVCVRAFSIEAYLSTTTFIKHTRKCVCVPLKEAKHAGIAMEMGAHEHSITSGPLQ